MEAELTAIGAGITDGAGAGIGTGALAGIAVAAADAWASTSPARRTWERVRARVFQSGSAGATVAPSGPRCRRANRAVGPAPRATPPRARSRGAARHLERVLLARRDGSSPMRESRTRKRRCKSRIVRPRARAELRERVGGRIDQAGRIVDDARDHQVAKLAERSAASRAGSPPARAHAAAHERACGLARQHRIDHVDEQLPIDQVEDRDRVLEHELLAECARQPVEQGQRVARCRRFACDRAQHRIGPSISSAAQIFCSRVSSSALPRRFRSKRHAREDRDGDLGGSVVAKMKSFAAAALRAS